MVGRCWSELNEAKVCEAARARRHCGHVRGRRQLMDSQRAGSPSKVRLAISEGCKTLMKAWAFLRDSSGVKGVRAEAAQPPAGSPCETRGITHLLYNPAWYNNSVIQPCMA